MKHRIAYIINSVEGGGAALPIPDLARVMREWGAEVRVFALTSRDGHALAAIRAAGLPVVVRPGGENDHLAALYWLNREMLLWRPSLIWTSLSRATLLGQILGTLRHLPVISWQHNAYLKPWNRRLLRLMQGRARLWVADSKSVAALTQQKLGVPAERLMIWPIFAADPTAPVSVPWQPGDNLRFGSLGRLHPVKGYDVLITALARLKANGFVPPVPFQIYIAGDGAELGALKAAARDAGVSDSIFWQGYVTNARQFLAGLHGYIQPSRSEGFCIAAHEAMQAGLPVIASSVGELPFSIATETMGRVVAPDDAAALAAALTVFLGDPGQLHQMGLAARTHVMDTFSRQRFEVSGRAILERSYPTRA